MDRAAGTSIGSADEGGGGSSESGRADVATAAGADANRHGERVKRLRTLHLRRVSDNKTVFNNNIMILPNSWRFIKFIKFKSCMYHVRAA